MSSGGIRHRGLLLCQSFTSPHFGPLSELVVIVGNPEHDRLSCWLFHYFGERSHFFAALPPMIWVAKKRGNQRE